MLWIHPIWQASATIVAVYAFFLGFSRFRASHLKHKTKFNWKRHVRFGTVALTAWLIGMAGGLAMVALNFPTIFITGTHAKVGAAMGVLVVIGLSSGVYMNKFKKKRRLLPLIHGVNNFILLLLAFSQAWTGRRFLAFFMLDN